MFVQESSDEEKGLTFADVLPKEIAVLRKAREKREVPERPLPLEQDIVGLAFSGGGIRSATFNLGVIQALASKNLLKFVDYLSTVSGGGYIGSWLSSWAYSVSRQPAASDNHIAEIEKQLNGGPRHIGDIVEPPQIHFLRKYSNYLTPKLGALSGDTLAFVGTYLRNLLLNQAILISALLALLLVPRTLGLIASQCYGSDGARISVVLAVISLSVVAMGVALNSGRKLYSPRNVIYLVAIPHFLFCVLTTYALWQVATVKYLESWLLNRSWVVVIGCSALVYSTLWFIALTIGLTRKKGAAEKPPGWYLVWAPALWAFPTGAVGGAFVLLVSHSLTNWKGQDQSTVWYILTFYIPLVTLLVLLVGVVHLGLIGRAYEDGLREWWARLGGAVLAITFFWFAICLLTLFFPQWMDGLWNFVKSGGKDNRFARALSSLGITGVVGGWVTTTFKGLFAAKGASTGPCPSPDSATGSSTKSTDDLLAQLAPPLFVLGLIAILSMGLDWLVPVVAGGPDTKLRPVLFLCFGLFLLSKVMGYRVDVNEFSLHNAYRNRLIRCYLGATHRPRNPQPFTGFDESDNIFLHDMLDLGAPFHIVNATLNVVKGKELALQSRKARSFTFTPLYSGFDYTEEKSLASMPGSIQPEGSRTETRDPEVYKSGSYRLTKNCSWKSRYPGARLGTAMAISGAAASPNMGHYTTGAVAFLLTIFSVRLGWWLGNPRMKKSWESGRPRSSWTALMNELTGNTNDDQSEVYLSDGGHFENLAIYELVRRRCRVIIACDAGADPSCACNDLASAIEKCRIDFKATIEIDLSEILLSTTLFSTDQRSRVSKAPFTMGTIRYADGSDGTLIYIKPSLNAKLPQDVLAYARLAEAFPHQSTVDQFFDEAQFESYRALGFACASAAIEKITEAVLTEETA
jgi:predicted acylesterase/phospholipase RssA